MLTIYLDTSDYAELYKDNATQEIVDIRNRLFDYVDKRQIRIGCSFLIIFELLQDYEPEFVEDRRRRARMVSRLCGSNSFPFLSDLLEGRTFSTDGASIPRDALASFSFSSLQQELKSQIMNEARLNRDVRRKLANRNVFAKFLREDSSRFKFNTVNAHEFPLPESFIKGDYFRRFFIGEVTEQEANRALKKCVTDPESFFEFWFQFYKKKNPLAEMIENGLQKLKSGISKMQTFILSSKLELSHYRKLVADIRRTEKEVRRLSKNLGLSNNLKRAKLPKAFDVQSTIRSIPIPDSMQKWPYEVRILMWEFMLAYTNLRKFHDSDIVDIMHAFYLPQCDLWRGDRTFCNLLLESNISYKSRIVPSLKLLPARIEEELKKTLNMPKLTP